MPSIRRWSESGTRWSACFAAMLLLLEGCGKPSRPGAPKVVAVTGKVTYRQKPVGGAVVTFRNGQDHEKSAFAIADAQGQYSSMTNDFSGMFPGDYRVIVLTPTKPAAIPSNYGTLDSSPLTLTVRGDGPQQFPINLQD